jgi:phage-related tail protein
VIFSDRAATQISPHSSSLLRHLSRVDTSRYAAEVAPNTFP